MYVDDLYYLRYAQAIQFICVHTWSKMIEPMDFLLYSGLIFKYLINQISYST